MKPHADPPIGATHPISLPCDADRVSDAASLFDSGLHDIGNARRLIAQHGSDLRFCHPWRRWLVWDGMHWAIDETREVERRAKLTARSIYREAARPELSEEQEKAISQHAGRSHSERAIKAMVHLAESEIEVCCLPGDLDINPWVLTVQNGTLDLCTGTLRPHRREDMLTKKLPVTYDSHAECPRWMRFLWEIFSGNTSLVDFMQRVVGYALTGSCREEVLFSMFGTGANGKSTFLNTLITLLDDFAWACDPGLLMLKEHDTDHLVAKADLMGRRLVVANETEQGRRLSSVTVKTLTSVDPINACRKYEHPFIFTPTHKVFLAGNHRPVIRDTDHAIWRRLLLIPFEVTIPPEQQDKELLLHLKAELPGILAWGVRGAVEWYANGLQPPAVVRMATDRYRKEEDIFGAFLAECCESVPEMMTQSSELYRAYKLWCEQSGEHTVSGTAFGLALSERGYSSQKLSGKVYRRGVRLVSDQAEMLSDSG